tara:strand:+ start:118 stop:483 length:366 start_codon:yes stop_codon:yes gene_type:complete
MNVVKFNAGSPLVEFETAVESLMVDYLGRMKEQVEEWFKNIESRESIVVSDNEGFLTTREPEDILNIINMQISVARDQVSDAVRSEAHFLSDGILTLTTTLCARSSQPHSATRQSTRAYRS